MTTYTRREYFDIVKGRYLRASRKEKTLILDEYARNTEQNRKYVIRKLQAGYDHKPKRRKARKFRYAPQVIAALVKIWEALDYPCSKRLKPMIGEMLSVLKRCGELNVPPEVEEDMLHISPATIDRRLAHERKYLHRSRFTTTKPGALLKSQIPIRLTDWDTSKVGYLEIDLVAHCGDNTFGEYLNTLNSTDISTGWSEQVAVMGKGQKNVFAGLIELRKRTPFDWLGIDSDNGSEFINNHLWRYCRQENIDFTRSRPNKKNDNAYVEQKNWTHVRKILGYQRYETEKEREIINKLYMELRLYKNFFQPVMKLMERERQGSKVIKRYDTPKTPYQRLLESNQIGEEISTKLQALYFSLNPIKLRKEIELKLLQLSKVSSHASRLQLS